MSAMASPISGVSIVSSTVCSGTDQRIPQSSASPAFVRRIHRSPVDSPYKGPVTRIFFPFDDVIMFPLVSSHAVMDLFPIKHFSKWPKDVDCACYFRHYSKRILIIANNWKLRRKKNLKCQLANGSKIIGFVVLDTMNDYNTHIKTRLGDWPTLCCKTHGVCFKKGE